VSEPWQPDKAMAAFIELDHDRARRRGYPEAVYCEGKTPSQVIAVAREVRASGTTTLFTRAGPGHTEAILGVLPDARYDEDARLLAWPPEPPAPSGGRVLVVAAGTADFGVAREAQLTAVYLGRAAELVTDVGIAGLHRILARLDQLRSARVIIVVAGMDGALPGLVAGLVAAPVIAVPTSVGYGAALGGVAPLLTMLNSCAPGVAVVNIDNGYGAGHLAAQITAPA
jgi:pyridinium-3,5-biscarboxylic acid mononucleotide synthase